MTQENKQLKEKLDCDLKWAFKCDELTKENQKLKKEMIQTPPPIGNKRRIKKKYSCIKRKQYKCRV